MRKLFLLFVYCCTYYALPIHAQTYFYNEKYYDNDLLVEAGISGGIVNAFTDIGGKKGVGKSFLKDLNWKNSKPAFGFYAMALYRSVIGVRLSATFGQVAAYDSILKNIKTTTYGRYERNLSFKSSIADFQLAAEFHPLWLKYYDVNEAPLFSPYLVAGIGFFVFNPQTKLKGNWYDLQPLHTEGQGFNEYPNRKPYDLAQLNFAVGGGVKYEINEMFHAKAEINYRFLKTDYLDDVSKDYVDPSLFGNYLTAGQASIARQLYSRKAELSPSDITIPSYQRGNPNNNDAFFTIELKVGITLGRQHR